MLGCFQMFYISQPRTSAISAGSAAQHVARGRVRHEATPTPAGREMPVLPQGWPGLRQAEGAPRRPISLHGCDTLRRARPSPSKEPRRVWSLGRGGEWALVVLDLMPRPGAGGDAGDAGRIPHPAPSRRAAAGPREHGCPPLGQRQALRYEGEPPVGSTGGRAEGVHRGCDGEPPGNEVKAKYTEKSVLATASQASKGSAGRTPTDNPR